MKYLSLFVSLGLALALSGCASKKAADMSSGDARQALDRKFADRVGKATKNDLVEELGSPNWCRPQPSGDESCRFYKKIGTKWTGEIKDKSHHEQYDEVFADFDSNGVLKSFKANSQR